MVGKRLYCWPIQLKYREEVLLVGKRFYCWPLQLKSREFFVCFCFVFVFCCCFFWWGRDFTVGRYS